MTTSQADWRAGGRPEATMKKTLASWHPPKRHRQRTCLELRDAAVEAGAETLNKATEGANEGLVDDAAKLQAGRLLLNLPDHRGRGRYRASAGLGGEIGFINGWASQAGRGPQLKMCEIEALIAALDT